MSTDPIRFLDDPSMALELREFMLDQDRPDALPERERRMVEGRIAASVLALPLSMKLGGLLSQGGTAASGSAGATTGTTAAASSALTGGSTAASSMVAGASVAPAATAGSALGVTSLAVAGAKGAGLIGALSMTKGIAVLGMALATGAGATYMVQEGISARSMSGQSSETSRAGTSRAETMRTESTRAIRKGSPASVAPAIETDPSPSTVDGRASVPTEKGQTLSLEDLEDVRHAAHVGEGRASSGSGALVGAGTEGRALVEQPARNQNASERLQEEVELLRRAQQLLRVDRVLAAETLERYDAKFPHGAMRAEYDVLRRRLVGKP